MASDAKEQDPRNHLSELKKYIIDLDAPASQWFEAHYPRKNERIIARDAINSYIRYLQRYL